MMETYVEVPAISFANVRITQDAFTMVILTCFS